MSNIMKIEYIMSTSHGAMDKGKPHIDLTFLSDGMLFGILRRPAFGIAELGTWFTFCCVLSWLDTERF